MLKNLPVMPTPTLDLIVDEEGFSAECSVEQPLDAASIPAFEKAVGELPRTVIAEGQREVRGRVFVDDGVLVVYVLVVGPGPHDQAAVDSAQALLLTLWEDVHRLADSSGVHA